MSTTLTKPSYTKLTDERNPITLLLKGPSGSGKTTKAATFPSPAIFNFDNNLSSLKKLPKEVREQVRIYSPSLDTLGNVVKPEKVWDRFITLLEEAMNDPAIKTIVIDSLSTLSNIVENSILKSGSVNAVMQIQDWGAFTRYIQWILESCCSSTSLRKHVVFTAHENVIFSKPTQMGAPTTDVLRVEILIPTNVKGKIELYFTDVWRTEVTTSPTGTAYWVNTRSSNVASAKCSLVCVDNKNVKDRFNWDVDSAKIIGEVQSIL